mgnify:CR=1 FL=1|jgi:hypothetical protein
MDYNKDYLRKVRAAYGKAFEDSAPRMVSVRLSVGGGKHTIDSKGVQNELTTTAAKGHILGLKMSGFGHNERIMSGGQAENALRFLKDRPEIINLVWNKEQHTAMLGRDTEGVLFGDKRPVMISSQDILKRQFPDVAATIAYGSPDELIKAIAEAPNDVKGGMGYLKTAGNAFLEIDGSINATNVNHLVSSAALMRAKDTGEKHVFGMRWYKTFLSQAGVKGLSSYDDSTLFSRTDPYNLRKRQKSEAVDVLNKQSNFYKALEHRAGSAYAEDIHVRMKDLKDLDDSVVSALRFAIDSEGSLYLGAGNDIKSYRPIPIGYMDNPGSVGYSRGGMVSGEVRIGGRSTTARPIYRDKKLTSYVAESVGEFFEGMTNTEGGRAGITTNNLAMAIHAGSQRVRNNAGLNELLNPNRSLGQTTILPALYAQHTATVPYGVLKGTHEALVDNLKGVANHKLDTGAYNTALDRDLASIPKTYTNLDFSIDAWTAVKHDMENANVMPRVGLKSLFLPGVLDDPRVLAKGIYALGSTREFIGKEIDEMKAANSRLFSGRASPVGMTSGAHSIQTAMQRHNSGISGRASSSSAFAAVLYKHSRNLSQDAKRFGDAQYYMTTLGQRGISYDSTSMRQVEKFMTRKELTDYLHFIKYDGPDIPTQNIWEDFIGSIDKQEAIEGFHQPPGQALPIRDLSGKDRKALNSFGPRKLKGLSPAVGTTHMFGVVLSEYNAERKIAFGREGVRDSMSVLVGSGSRATITKGVKGTHGMFGRNTEKAVHLIAGMDALHSQNAFSMQFSHRLNMLAMPGVIDPTKGAYNAEELAGKRGLTMGKFVDAYSAKAKARGLAGGAFTLIEAPSVPSGEKAIGEAHIVADSSKYTQKEFLSISDEIFAEHGVDANAKDMKAKAMFKLANRIGAMKEANSRDIFSLSQVFKRAGEGEDVSGMKHPLRVRMETMKLIGAGSSGENGPSALYKIIAAGFEEQVGKRVGGTARLSKKGFGSIGYLKTSSNDLKQPFNAMFTSGFSPREDQVMSIADFKTKFGSEVNSLSVARGNGISYDDIRETYLYKKGRKGFYLDLVDDVDARIAHNKGSRQYTKQGSRYMWIDSGDDFRRSLKGAGQESVRFGKDSLHYSVLEMITHAQGEDDILLREAAGRGISSQMGIGVKEGLLDDSKFVFEAPVSTKARLVSTFDSDGSRSLLDKDGNVKLSEFDVEIDKHTLSEMFTDKKTRVVNTRELKKAEKKLARGGHIFGMAAPTPIHGVGHVPIVKLKLADRNIRGAGPVARMGNFLASMLERDFDKDIISLMAFFGKKMESYGNKGLGFDRMQKELAILHASQAKSFKSQADLAESSLEAWKDAFLKVSNNMTLEQRAVEYRKFHGFGANAPIAWTPFYSQFEFSQNIASRESEEVIAKNLKTLSLGGAGKNKITEGTIKEFRSGMRALDMGFRDTISEGIKLHLAVAQGVLAKGSELIPSFQTWHDELDQIHMTARNNGSTMKDVIEQTREASRKLGEDIASKGKLKGYSGIWTGAEKSNIFAELMGVFVGAHIYAKSQHLTEGGHFATVTKPAAEGGSNAYNVAMNLDVDNMRPRSDGVKVNIDEELAEMNNRSKSGQRMADAIENPGSAVKKAGGFLADNWRTIGMVGGGLIAARAMYSAFSSGPEPPRLPISNMAPAPLPPEPMVSRQQSGPNIPMPTHSVRASNMNGMTSSRSNTSRMSSVNIQGPSSSFNMGAVGSNWSRTTVRDERAFTSGWEHQRLSEQNGKSDFVHKYMDL